MDIQGEGGQNKRRQNFYNFVLSMLTVTLQGKFLPLHIQVTDTMPHIQLFLGDENNSFYLKCIYYLGEGLIWDT